jgi:hypothetical protein
MTTVKGWAQVAQGLHRDRYGRNCRDTALKDVDVLPNRMHLLLLAGDAVDLLTMLTADC